MARVLFSVPTYPPHVGSGAAVYYPQLLHNLRTRQDVYLIAPFHPGASVTENSEGVSIYRTFFRLDSLPDPVHRTLTMIGLVEIGLRILFETLPVLLTASVLILRERIDVFHVHATSFMSPAAIIASHVFDVHLVLDCRDENFPTWLVRSAPACTYLSCASNIDQKLRSLDIGASDIIRTPIVNPGYVSEYSKGQSDSGTELVFMGRLREQKGVDLLVAAVERLAPTYPDVRLTMIGDGPAKRRLKDLVRRKGLTDVVSFTGELEHREALQRLANTDILVLPSESEGMPRVVLEAMEIGVPVVATPVGDIPEVLSDGETGICIEFSVESTADGIERLLEDDELRAEIGARARERVRHRDWETVVSRVERAYDTE